jgi:hypothetical protein
MNRHVALMIAIRKTYRTLVRKPEGKKPFGRPTQRWEDNIKINLKGIWRESVD